MPTETQLAIRNWGLAVLVMGFVVLGRHALDPWFGNQHPFVLVYGGVALVVWFAGWKPAVLAAVLGFAGTSFWFVEPRGSAIPRGLISVFFALSYTVSCGAIIAFGEGMRRARRRAELVSQQLRQSEETLREASRRKDEFLAMLAHELRNPLAPMMNALQCLRLRDSENAEFHHMRASLERQVHHMAQLVDDLLDVARITRGRIHLQKDYVNVATVIEDAVESVAVLIKAARHDLVVDLPSEPMYVHADHGRLSQVFINLLNNAAKFTPDGGRIAVSASVVGPEIEIRIRDTGVGIEDGMLTRIFDMFTQADSSLERTRGGLGIGLTLAHQLVILHGGRLSARSEGLNKGSEFVVCLQLTQNAAAIEVLPDTLTYSPHPRRILLVDDNHDAARGMGFLLKSVGHETRVEHDGLSGVLAVSEFQPDIVLLDIGLPTLNGYEVARRIRAMGNGADCVIVAITGWGTARDRERALEAGCDLHLTKPVRPPALVALIDGAPQRLCAVIPPRLARLHMREDRNSVPSDENIPVNAVDPSTRCFPQTLPQTNSIVEKPGVSAPLPAMAHLLTTANHDFRRAIHSIGVLIELMRAQMTGSTARSLLDHAQASLDSTEKLVLGLLEVSKLETGAICPASAVFYLSEVFEALRRSEEPAAQAKGLTLEFTCAPAAVQSDPLILFGMLRTLLSHVIFHTNRGEIHIAAREQARSIHVAVSAQNGVPWNDRNSAEPQVGNASNQPQAERGDPSASLNRSIVERYAALLGHRISVSEQTRGGICFDIEIPLRQPVTT